MCPVAVCIFGTETTCGGEIKSCTSAQSKRSLTDAICTPTIVDGLTVALSHGEGASEYFGYGIGYDADMFSIGYVSESTNTVKNKTVSVGVEVAGISFGADQVSYKDDDDATAEIATLRENLRLEHEFMPDFFVG